MAEEQLKKQAKNKENKSLVSKRNYLNYWYKSWDWERKNSKHKFLNFAWISVLEEEFDGMTTMTPTSEFRNLVQCAAAAVAFHWLVS